MRTTLALFGALVLTRPARGNEEEAPSEGGRRARADVASASIVWNRERHRLVFHATASCRCG
jgi:hypothetical protein